MPPTASGNLPHKATNGSTMDILSGYLTTVQLKSQQDALGGSRDPASAPVPAPRPMQKRKEQVDATITTTSTCGAPSFGEYSAISSAAAGFPFQVDESTQFQYFMAPLPQDVAVKAEGADMMGGLDPHYFEQYGGAAPFAPAMDGSSLHNSSFYNMVNGISQLPPLSQAVNLPWISGFVGFNDFDLGMSMALPNLNMAMDPIPLPTPLPLDPATNAGADSTSDSIPLLCHICPKKPTFSDVSHLLTHISSKSHLAARFKLQLSDDASHQQALLHFDEWAEHYGINKLLKNRQDAKELKKQNNLKRQRRGNEKSRRSNGPPTEVKLEPSDSLHLQQLENNPLNQGGWHLHTPHASFADPYQTPPIKRAESVYPLPDSPQEVAFMNDVVDVKLGSDTLDGIEGTDGGSGATKLKGIVLPGMDLFDAATPDQKRMRNQKKHESVLKNMSRASQAIEQTECVWDEQLQSITRTRNVYDSPSVDGSPESGDEEVPVVKKRRVRRVAPTDNGPQRQTRASTRGSKVAKKKPAKAGKKASKVESEAESEVENLDSQHAHAISGFDHNFNDNSMGGDIFADKRLGLPAGATDSPTANQQFSLPHRTAMQGLPSNRPMSSMFSKPDNQPAFGFFDKENDRSPFNLQPPGTMPSSMNSYFTQARHNMQASGLNPLCVQRQDSPGFPYMFGGQPFDMPKPTPTPFQSMNVMDYDPMTPGSQFQTGTTHNQNGAFNI